MVNAVARDERFLAAGGETWAYDPAGGDGLLEERSYGTSASSGCAIGTAEFTEAYDYDTDARPETVTTTMSYIDPTGLVVEGLCSDPREQCMNFGGGDGGYSTRSVTVTTTEYVYGTFNTTTTFWVPDEVEVWDPHLDMWVTVDQGGYQSETHTHSYVYPVTTARTVQVPVDDGVADEPMSACSATCDSPSPRAEPTEEDWTERWFRSGKQRYVHESNAFCRGCQMDEVVRLLNRVGFHPNQKRPFVPGREHVGDVDLPFVWGIDEVTTKAIYEGGRQVGVRNTTVENHELHSGAVERTIVRDGDAFRIRTVGTGTGRWGLINILFDEWVWGDVDDTVIGELGP